MSAPTPTLSRSVHYVELDILASDRDRRETVEGRSRSALKIRHAQIVHVNEDGTYGLRVHRLGHHGGDYDVAKAKHDEAKTLGTFHFPAITPAPSAPAQGAPTA